MSGMLVLRNEPVAFVGATRWYLVPVLEMRPAEDRERTAVAALCRALVHDPACVLLEPTVNPPRPPSR